MNDCIMYYGGSFFACLIYMIMNDMFIKLHNNIMHKCPCGVMIMLLILVMHAKLAENQPLMLWHACDILIWL